MTRRTVAWRRYLRFWRADIPADVDAEIAFHVEMRVDEYVARGMSEADARRAVLARLGDIDAAKTQSVSILVAGARDARNANVIESFLGDLRFALRSLLRAPGWTAVVLLTIALGVGATTTVFTVADSLLLRPLDYPAPARVVTISRLISIGERSVEAPMRIDAVRLWQANARSIHQVQPFTRTEIQLGTGDDATTIDAGIVDTGFFSFAGARLILGRTFGAADVLPNSQNVVVLSEGLWRAQFGGARDVLGKTMSLGNKSYVIVGVAPSTLMLPAVDLPPSQVWLPFVVGPNERTTTTVARLAPGATPASAAAELQSILDRTSADPLGGMTATMSVRSPTDTFGFRQALLMLSGAVALLLLVASVNLANLLLARGVSRERELAVRYALGAGRSRLILLLLTESMIVAVAGGALAVFVGWTGLQLLDATHPAKMFAFAHVTPGRSLVVIAAIVACVIGIATGTLTAMRVAHGGIGEALRVGAFSSRAHGGRLRAALVVGEVALSAVLLVGALLLIHAVYDLRRTRLGFDARGIYAVTFNLRSAQLSAEQRAAFAERLRTEAQRLPSIDGITISDTPPTNARRLLAILESEERPAPADAPATSTPSIATTPDFFKTMRMPLLAGRGLDEQSAANGEIVISEELARSLWPDGNAVGRRLRQSPASSGSMVMPWMTVVGVVPNIVTGTLLDTKPTPAIYRAIGRDWDVAMMTLVVRLKSHDAAPSLRRLAASVRPGPALPVIRGLEEQLNESAAEPRFTMVVLITFAALAVVLATTGLYGVIAYTVAQRTREIGVRITLGATRSAIARLVIGNGLRLAFSGVVLGLVGALAATRVIEHLLYGVSRLDPFSFVGGAVFLLLISAMACIVPTARATSVDPIVAVRVE